MTLRMLSIREVPTVVASSPPLITANELNTQHLPVKPRKITTRGPKTTRRKRFISATAPVPHPSAEPLQPLSDAAFAMGVALDETERLLIELREVRGLPWISCKQVFKSRGNDIQVPALQMRYKRLKDRLTLWEPEDVSSLAQHISFETSQ